MSGTDDAGTAAAEAEPPIGAVRRWAITATVMTVTVMQVLDVTVINVALPHMQGSLSAGVDEISWVLTSYLAANAVILPATGWLASVLGRKRFFLICTVAFTAGVGAVRARAGPEHADHRAHPAGHRRRPAHADVPGHHVGDLPVPSAGHGDGRLGHGDHDGADLRADAGRLDHGQLVVALDVLHQRAHRHPRLLRGQRDPLRSAVPAQARPGRRPRHRPHGDRVPVAPALHGPGRALRVVRLDLHHGARDHRQR
jgi:hypothetical protein